MNRKRFAGTLLTSFAAAGATATAQTSGREPYKIGVTFPLTGPLAASTLLYMPGIELAVNDVNAAGGVGGHPLQLVVEDTQGTPQGGITAMRKVVQVDGVQAVLSIYTNVATAQIPLAEQVKVPIMTTVETNVLRNKSPYAFQHGATIDNKGRLFGAYWKANKSKRVYAFVINNSAGPFFSSIAKAAAEGAGAEYQEATFNDGDSDYRGLVARAKEYRPDSIFLAELGGLAGAQIVRQLREGGMTVPVCMPGIFFDEPTWKNAVGPYLETIVMSGITYDPRTARQFIAAYEAKTGHRPSYQAGENYDIIKMFAAAIQRSSYNGEAIRNQLATLKGVPCLFGGMITMDSTSYSVPDGDALYQVRRGNLERVKV